MSFIIKKSNKEFGCFIHIPQNAGFEISEWLKKNTNCIIPSIGRSSIPSKEILKNHMEFSFAVVRNPWERMVDAYFYYRNKNQPLAMGSFEEWIKGEWGPTFSPSQTSFIDERIKLLIRFEEFEKGWKKVTDILGCNNPIQPIKKFYNGDYKDYYNNETIDIIEKRCKEDIENFNYEFNDKIIITSRYEFVSAIPPEPPKEIVKKINLNPELSEGKNIPTKVYIIRIDNELSKNYALTAANSCDKIGLSWEYFEGIDWKKVGSKVWSFVPEIKWKITPKANNAAAAATASHYKLWNKIANENETVIILEHDAVMLNNVNVSIPDGEIVVLGYKVEDIENYNNIGAVKDKPIQILSSRAKHGGAHAYAITPKTAKMLLEHIHNAQNYKNIDDQFFYRDIRGALKMSIIDPIAAIGWIRESTIWKKSATDNYKPILESFEKNYISKKNLGLKG